MTSRRTLLQESTEIKFYVTHTYHHTIDPALFGVSKISSKTKFEARKVTENPNAILFQTRAEDKYALAEEMRDYYHHDLEINSWGGPLNILECAPKGVNKAFALNYLLETYGLNRKDLIAFGDEQNDTDNVGFRRNWLCNEKRQSCPPPLCR